MYRLLRNVHLALGLFSAVFLLGYAVSAALMAYPLYSPPWKETQRQIEVPAGVDTAPRALARWLMDEHGLRGDLTKVSATDAAISLTIARTGTNHRVQYHVQARTARITSGVASPLGMLNRIHHVGGVWHEYWAIDAWGWFLFAVSICLLLLATTGVAMWFSRHRERRMGTVLLGAGLAWGVTLLVLVRYS